ncbi:hypothetical protein BB427_11415 [Pseudoalteromonas sp. BMB]|uniref:helix-turn-helix domain-containing protein n=1 Tax=Pseudoalteromonas sp. BMB TaxID=1874619 RepID=UPI00083D716B|nr:helix-turn-helix transcriptional regulator [Pseudoalteromonas sp. BMB]ODB41093.1 hypothetical protein BB427_11415 [Pseudoalteromonas sp. BMB]
MLTKFGIAVRKIRIERSMKLTDMAKGLDVTSAYLSAVENGKKKLTTEFAEKTIRFLDLDDDGGQEVLDAAYESQKEFSIKIKDDDSDLIRTVAGAFARKIESSDLSDEDAETIINILKGN